jgi:phage terminase large subunit
MAELQFKDTTATKKIFSLTKRIRAVCGGTSASKTISILVWCIDYCQSTENKKVDVVSESYPHLELGAMADFQAIMKVQGYWNQDRWNESKHIYMFETGSRIKFYSVDTYGKAHGPRRDVLFVNEANNIPWNIFDQLKMRTREVIWIDWNPSNEFWYYEHLENKIDHDFLRLTYLDNESLDRATVEEIESHKDNKRWWQVYGMGMLGEVEGRIYTGWRVCNTIPHEARLERYGLDFGYSNDETAIIAIYRYNGGFILDEICHQKGLSNKNIADILLNQPKAMVICDSAEPKSIDELKAYGVLAFPAIKGQGSVAKGISFVQAQKIWVTQRSVNLIKAYRNYMFVVDEDTGLVTNEPDDTVHTWSNAMDAVRYGMNSFVPRREKVNDPNRQRKRKRRVNKGYSVRMGGY